MTRHSTNTNDGMDDYAERHGATFDPVRGAWYVTGTVPTALLNLVLDKQAERQEAVRLSGLQPLLHVDPETLLPLPNKKRRQVATTPIDGTPPPALPSALHSHVEATLAVVRHHIGSDERVQRWLYTPKIALQRRTPIDAMATVEGCHQVVELAKHVND